jgi:F-type H+-transporting ATPase subunit delta
MNESKISVRYAKALFQHAIELGKLEDIKKDIELVFKTSTEVPELNLYLLSPITKVSEKKQLALNVFGKFVSKETLAFLDLMIKNRRESYITDSTRNFLQLYKKHAGIKSVELISVQAISPEFKTAIIAKVQSTMNSKIELTEKIDKSLLGGYILRIEDQQYDASVSNKLKQMKKSLLETSL